ncbi:MAG TPA: hypothetical protein PKA00_12015 [Saprospiraceae bacterium]|nr:hypothetical protein [Saprospiraceae bacterium]HMQ83631.1 hypothetical protein [Saprospiraceae bacterium]
MIIANPIYDVVFKYLLEDVGIARELLSTILGEEVQSLELKPQETATETGGGINILRFDFKAIIKKKNGEQSKVLIELQKAKQAFDVMRFRRYLGENYRKEDVVTMEQDGTEKRPLPIVTIYFLGFPLDNIASGAVKINREYRDIVTQEILDIKEDFVELLTHDSYLIQVRKLAKTARNKLERVLQVFSPIYQSTTDKHQLDFQGEMDDPLIKKMVDRLGRAIASEEIREKMDVEDELDRVFEREMKKLTSIIAEKESQLLNEQQRAEKEKKRAEKEKKRAEEEKKRAEEEKKRAEEEIQKNLELQRQIEALKKQIKP